MESITDSQDTPLMRQYWEIKNQHHDAILLFRLGDFYEMFFDDAQVASKILDITLTSRDKSAANPIPLCGVPYHSVAGYISRLLDRGHKVAICEQVEDPKEAKGIVRREVVRVISPGLQTELEGLSERDSNALVSVYATPKEYGIAWVDVSTGTFRVTQFASIEQLEEEVWRLSPKELIVPEVEGVPAFKAWISQMEKNGMQPRIERIPPWVYESAAKKILERFHVTSVEGFGLSANGSYLPAASAILHYVETQNRTKLPHLNPPVPYSHDHFVHIDRATRIHLEIDRPQGGLGLREQCLLGALDETQTSMGSRKLKEWLQFPLLKPQEIEKRLDSVEELLNESELREEIRSHLKDIYDLERLMGRIASARANARDLLALCKTLEHVKELRLACARASSEALRKLQSQLDDHPEICELLTKSIAADCPPNLKEGGLISGGFSKALDELREVTTHGRQWIAELETRERARTGISSLKVGYNRVFGYFIEITNTHRDKAPHDYQRKQTLANAERFVTPELKDQEAKILSAEEKINGLEFELFEKIRNQVAEKTRSIQGVAEAVAELDVFCSFSRVAGRYRYTRPKMTEKERIQIVAGRHPFVERFVGTEGFVPNDIDLDCASRQMIILTGPNMAGKSTIMRQVALITLMAQVGSFVPADEAEIGVVDRIFSRVGASDDLSQGRSTFMVEMNETANILRNATSKSLVLLDEIGRGTSTYDGLAIAWAVAEDLHDRVGARTIFATHYHELTDLARTKEKVRNMNVAVKEWGDQIIFLRTLADGAVNRSYGIEVARLAGVPDLVITRAREILNNLEKGEFDALGQPVLAGHDEKASAPPQLDLFHRMGDELIKDLDGLNPDALAPREALDLLYAWKKRFLSS